MKDSIMLRVGNNLLDVLNRKQKHTLAYYLKLDYEDYTLRDISFVYFTYTKPVLIEIYDRDIEKLKALRELIEDDLEFFLIVNDHVYSIVNNVKVKAKDYSRYFDL